MHLLVHLPVVFAKTSWKLSIASIFPVTGCRKSDKSKPVAASMAFGAQLIGQSAGGGAQPLLKCATLPSLTGVGSSVLLKSL